MVGMFAAKSLILQCAQKQFVPDSKNDLSLVAIAWGAARVGTATLCLSATAHLLLPPPKKNKKTNKHLSHRIKKINMMLAKTKTKEMTMSELALPA